jgi:hypothetical protein
LEEGGRKEPTPKQLATINRHIEALRTESEKEEPDQTVLRKLSTALRNYYYSKKLRLDDQLYRTLEDLLRKKNN